ncbi:Uncharacterised protein [Yersinia enterocolitica]|uniref:Uncharacterized protein n=1 Tax=Yersinia enterocolitica TaxID=630 RepID=A0ABP1Y233_YEREN|nr:hypothetical protein DJ61_758 [Yersinia enterocolitica]CFV23446.1 Uncharacterised protein [Yersinia enterocolitica]CND35786.1 Uncharacterised protein [Yersinia enterocolitica]CND70844.1 Uncharacterised protein [Yersinia enterocolitica]CNE99272.1 Uncharacterised protein [Yersinia enterocolitica]
MLANKRVTAWQFTPSRRPADRLQQGKIDDEQRK